jgi:NADPH:quinone reductase-like Zn-dependent oxidoreductase
VIGASGGVGHIAVQVAAAEGAGLVVGVVSFFYFSCGQLH